MATRNDVIKQALESLGPLRFGQEVSGDLLMRIDKSFQQMLKSQADCVPFDFDPTGTEIPDEHANELAEMVRYSPHLDAIDPKLGPPDRRVMFAQAEKTFHASVIGESDYIESEVYDF